LSSLSPVLILILISAAKLFEHATQRKDRGTTAIAERETSQLFLTDMELVIGDAQIPSNTLRTVQHGDSSNSNLTCNSNVSQSTDSGNPDDGIHTESDQMMCLLSSVQTTQQPEQLVDWMAEILNSQI